MKGIKKLILLMAMAAPVLMVGQDRIDVHDGNGRGELRDTVGGRLDMVRYYAFRDKSTAEGYALQRKIGLDAPNIATQVSPSRQFAPSITRETFVDSLAQHSPDVEIPTQYEYPEYNSLIWQRNIFANDFRQQGKIAQWNDGYLEGYSMYDTQPLLGSVRQAGALATQHFGDRWTVSVGAMLMKYNVPWNAYNTFGGEAQVGYLINDNISVTAFGNYESAPFWSNASRGGMGVFGGYMTFKTNNDKWGVDVGAQNVRDFQSGRSATVPIIRPFYNLHGQKLGIDLGGLLYQLFENASINLNGGGYGPVGAPAPMPMGQKALGFERGGGRQVPPIR